MISIRRPAALAVLVLASGCILPTEPARAVAVQVRVGYVARLGSADSVEVNATFNSMDAGRVRFRSDTLYVENVAGTAHPGGGFNAGMPLDSASAADGVRVRLPVPTVGAMPHAEFMIVPAMRSGSPSVDVREGQDIQLPVKRGGSGTLPAPEYEAWSLTVWRGDRSVSFNGAGPLPSPVVVPWTLLPSDGGDALRVTVMSFRAFPMSGTPAGPVHTSIRADATLEWAVRIVP